MKKHYIAIYKPYMMLCQFTKEKEGDVTLSGFPYPFPKDCYSVGRLDKDSEGLLLLTNDNFLKTKFLTPTSDHSKIYYVQLEGIPTDEAIAHLQKGVDIRIKGKIYHTKKAEAQLIEPPVLPERTPPIRYRANIPASWLKVTLTEGKNRQVRRMCAAVGFPVLRLVRYGMEGLGLDHLKENGLKNFEKESIYHLLNMG